MSSNSSTCSACGQGPRCHPTTNQPIPLKACSRCHLAWYHDANCQRQHYPFHKLKCRQATSKAKSKTKSKTRTKPSSTKKEKTPVFYQTIQHPDERGRGLVAKQELRKGTMLGKFSPLVHPVLLECERALRCTLCFGPISKATKIHNCCSSCVPPQWLKEEEHVVERVLEQHPHCRMFPTAMIVYRLLLASAEVQEQLQDLQHHDDKNERNEEEQMHSQAIATLVRWMLQESQTGVVSAPDQRISILLSQLKTNAFSIANGECVPIGIGVYPQPAYYVNHSCRPNLVQTFEYGTSSGTLSLRYTTTTTIAPGDELSISYIDATCPRHLRQDRLYETYRFQCHCAHCREEEPNAEVDFCKNEAFQKSIETKSITDWKAAFEMCHRLSVSNASWYFQECGENYLQCLLTTVATASNDEVFRTALRVGEMLLEGTKQQKLPIVDVLKVLNLQYKCAKLRLYLADNDATMGQALQELQHCLTEFRLYYPSNHEWIVGIQRDLTLR